MQKLILPINDFKPTAGYKNAKYQKEWGYTHYGVDCVSNSKKTALYGLGNGEVITAGLDGLNGKITGAGSGCGYVLVVVYKDVYNHVTKKVCDVTVTYMHLDSLPRVKAGDKVSVNTLLGYYGNTGANTTGAHLHVQVDSDVKYPLYCCGLSSKGHSILKKGTADSTINPMHVFHIGEGQSIKAGASSWYNAADFKNIPKAPIVKVVCTLSDEKSAKELVLKLERMGIKAVIE